MTLEQVKIYRMLHIDNIPHVVANGLTHKDSPNANPEFITIGDVSLIKNRNTRQVNVDNGNNFLLPEEVITLGHYTPFYFGIKMPMLYVVQHGGNFVEKSIRPEEIVYVVCSVQSIINTGLTFYFSDGHATDILTTFYNKNKIKDLSQIIEWTAIRTSYWGGQENLNLKRKKQAEFLVQGDIPSHHIVGYGCFNDSSKQKLISFGINEQLVKIIPNAYY